MGIPNSVTDSNNEDIMKSILKNKMNKFGLPQNPISKKDIEIDSKKCKSIINKVQPPINKDNVMENNSVEIK